LLKNAVAKNVPGERAVRRLFRFFRQLQEKGASPAEEKAPMAGRGRKKKEKVY